MYTIDATNTTNIRDISFSRIHMPNNGKINCKSIRVNISTPTESAIIFNRILLSEFCSLIRIVEASMSSGRNPRERRV